MRIWVGTRAAAIAICIAACNRGHADATSEASSSTTDADTTTTGISTTTSSSTTGTSTTSTDSSTTHSSTTDPSTGTSLEPDTGGSTTTTTTTTETTGPTPYCGDGQQDPGEACDDGNRVDDDACSNACILNFCTPTGQRAELDSLGKNGASGCWDGNPCEHDLYSFVASAAQNFQGFGESISCTGEATCVGHVGVATYEDSSICQGRWDVLCDGVLLGTLDTLGTACIGSAMGNGCSLAFEPRMCAEIELRAALDDDQTFKCCEGNSPDSMIVAVSAW